MDCHNLGHPNNQFHVQIWHKKSWLVSKIGEVNFVGLQLSKETVNTFEDTDFRFSEASVHIRFEDEESLNFEVSGCS